MITEGSFQPDAWMGWAVGHTRLRKIYFISTSITHKKKKNVLCEIQKLFSSSYNVHIYFRILICSSNNSKRRVAKPKCRGKRLLFPFSSFLSFSFLFCSSIFFIFTFFGWGSLITLSFPVILFIINKTFTYQ